MKYKRRKKWIDKTVLQNTTNVVDSLLHYKVVKSNILKSI